MVHSSSLTSAPSSLSSARTARAAVFAPVLLATLSLGSLARAQQPASAATTDSAAPQSSALPVAAPATGEPAAEPSATTASPEPAAPEAAPLHDQGSVAAASDERSLHLPTRVHQGFYLRLTSGPSLLTLRGHGPAGASASITDGGPGGSLAIGGAIAPGLVLAGVLQGTAFDAEFKGGPFENATVSANGKTKKASANAQGGFGMVGVLIDWYPQPTGNWHAGFSTGVGGVGLTNSADDSELGGVNFAGSVFGGYDWVLGRNWALGLQLTASAGTTTHMKEGFDSHDAHDSGYRLTPFSLGIQGSLLYF